MQAHAVDTAPRAKAGAAASKNALPGSLDEASATSTPMRPPGACACGGGCPRCQRKALPDLPVGAADDPHEREADAVAARVMRGASGAGRIMAAPAAHVQPKCAACGERDDEPPLQAKAETAPPATMAAGPSGVSDALGAGGHALSARTRADFESRFGGHDFSRVRIHTGEAATRSARALHAQAYTVGHDIVFGAGRFAPETSAGRLLLAHELTHVLQQAGGSGRVGVRAAPPALRRKGDPEDLDAAQDDQCATAPRHLGDLDPIPPVPRATHRGTQELMRIPFCLDSNQPSGADPLAPVRTLAPRNRAGTRFLVHGYASVEGAADYNFRLAGHRANRVAEAVRVGIEAQVRRRMPRAQGETRIKAEVDSQAQSRLETGTQGPTSEFGPPAANRVVVIYGQRPGIEDQEEPACEDAPRHLGDVQPEVPCDLPSMDLAGMADSDQLGRFHFCLDSDVLSDSSTSDIRAFAGGQAAKSSFVVHGFASEEGAADYNRRLACHRALRVARELMAVGVRPERIVEVASLGETTRFGDAAANRVALVLAEEGAIDPIPDGATHARNDAEKGAIRDAARARLLAGQYALAADAYLSFWTCGRTATVSQAVERLNIQLPLGNDDELTRDRANGTEQGFGVNTVRLSNVALRADNAIECTMGRLVDMAFHQAVFGDADLAGFAVHPAGLHLIHLAGLAACRGRHASANDLPGKAAGIDAPLADDPRAGRRLACTAAPQPTRLLPPTQGAKDRQVPTFEVVDSHYVPGSGRFTSNFDPDAKENAKTRLVLTPNQDILTASAEVQLKGQPDTFADYEVGFMQAVTDDETQVDYDSGNHVIQGLPTPVRLAHLHGDAAAPPPWTAVNAMQRPDAGGKVSLAGVGARLATEAAIGLQQVDGRLPPAAITGFEHDTQIAIWLVARRLGAPLDRFSVHFIDGVTYSLVQLTQLNHRRERDPALEGSDKAVKTDKEVVGFSGGFRSGKPSLLPADPSQARFDQPVAGDISWFNQVRQVVAAAAAQGGMGLAGVAGAAAEILDLLEVDGTRSPRLGFDYIPLTITLPIVRRTGRLQNLGGEIAVHVDGPGLGNVAAHELARALDFRIRDRSFQPNDVVVNPAIVPGSAQVGDVVVTLPALGQPANLPPENQPDLTLRADVRDNMAEALACTLLTATPKFIEVGVREFGRAYTMDRDKGLHAFPSDRLAVGSEEKGGVFELHVPCPEPSEGAALGDFHTHPEPEALPDIDDADAERARHCGPQHFIVSEAGVFRYFPDKSVRKVGITLPKGQCHAVNMEFIKVVDDEGK